MILDSINQIVSIYIFGAGLVVINIPNQLRYVVDIEKELYTKVVFILLLCKPRGIRNISYNLLCNKSNYDTYKAQHRICNNYFPVT